MKLSLAVHGGLAAGLRLGRPPTVVDTATLPEDEARELADLLAAAKQDPPAADRSSRAPDEMSYTITVDDGSAQEVLRRSDTTMSQGFADLMDRLHRLASAGG
jgi:Emfourin